MVCRGPERLYCRSREAPAGRDAPARRTAEAAHANRVPRPPRLRRRRRGSGPPVLSTPAASTIGGSHRFRAAAPSPACSPPTRPPSVYAPNHAIETSLLPGRAPASDCEGACHGVQAACKRCPRLKRISLGGDGRGGQRWRRRRRRRTCAGKSIQLLMSWRRARKFSSMYVG